jgi:multidrug efflux pump subunit AcrB
MEKPRIYKREILSMVMFVQVSGALDELAMKAYATTVRDEILNLPGVTSANMSSSRPYEVSIEISDAQLRLYDLTLQEVATAIRGSSIDLPAGALKTTAGNILLRTESQAYHQYDFEQVPLRVRDDGTKLLLGDVATVTDGFVETNFYQLFDNKLSLGIQVYAVGNQNALDISETVNAYVDAKSLTLPPEVSIDAWLDASYYLDSVILMMLDNLWYGVLLVFLVLGLFLRMQLAFWVIVGLPVCFLGALSLMPLADISVNILSLFGFILVLGIVVDDAIIIGESTQSEVEKSGVSIDSVTRGAYRVAMPATFGVLTTIAAFVPMLMMEGPAATTAAAIGGVVILCLIFSLIESKFILPAHLAAMRPLPPATGNDRIRTLQDNFARGFKRFVAQRYQPLLILAIKHRYSTVALFVAMLFIAIGLVASPLVRVVVFPALPHDYLSARVEVVDGAPESQTVKITGEVADAIRAINDERPESERFIKHMVEFSFGSSGRIFVEIDKTNSREVNAIELASAWRERVGTIAGTKSLQTNGSIAQGSGTTFNFRLLSANSAQLDQAAVLLQAELKKFAGVYDIESTSNSSAQEINVDLKPGAALLGLTRDNLASQVRAGFYGIEAQRMQRDGEEVKVMVRYPRDERASIGSLESMFIRTPDGDDIPFMAVADMEVRKGYSTLVRSDGKRAVVITANADTNAVVPTSVVEAIQGDFARQLATRYPDVTLTLGGSSQDEQKFLQKLIFMVSVTLFAIYALMAIPLKSYLQPLIIMAVIPFGMIGAILGHIVLGLPFSFLSMFGIVALSGVVVNDSLIMVDFVNRGVDEGMDLESAATQAGTQRIRAILLTSLTTFFGLLPMLVETSLTAQIVLPMAVSLGFGILFATVITLFLIPCLYVILVDVDRGPQKYNAETYAAVLARERLSQASLSEAAGHD